MSFNATTYFSPGYFGGAGLQPLPADPQNPTLTPSTGIEALAETLRAQGWFAAVAGLDYPDFDIDDLPTPKCEIVLVGWKTTDATDGFAAEERVRLVTYQINIVTASERRCMSLDELMEQTADLLHGQAVLTSLPGLSRVEEARYPRSPRPPEILGQLTGTFGYLLDQQTPAPPAAPPAGWGGPPPYEN